MGEINQIDTTVVITIKNRPKDDVVRYLKALQSQTYKHNLIVVDYGSDWEHLIWERALSKLFKFELIEVKNNTQIFNSGRALNIGFRKVKTPYIITTDADVLLSSQVIEKTVKYLKAENCIVFCQRFDLNQDGTIGLMHQKAAIGTLIGMKTDWIFKIKGVDEHFEGYGGWDNDMKVRAEQDGLKVIWLNEVEKVVILHIWHPIRPRIKMNDNLNYLKTEKPLIRNKDWGQL